MEDKDDYEFLQIRDAITSINQKVNLISAIIEFGLPKKTRGADWCCTLKIIDESYPKPGICVNVFAQSVEILPRISSLGDIIQLSHVVMKAYNGKVNAVFNKACSSFALYEGKDGRDFLPYQYSKRYHPKDRDSKFIAGLRKWLADFHSDEGPNSFLLLREMKEGEQANLVCKVLHICEVSEQEWMAFVWDGTDSPPLNIDMNCHQNWGASHIGAFLGVRNLQVDYDRVPFVTLMDVLTCSQVTSKFKCIVRLVAAFPWQVEDYGSHLGTCMIRLTIEDRTSRIHAFLFAEDGEKFFGGYPSINEMARKRNRLLGVAVNDDGKEIQDALRNPLWVRCCLKSYYLDKGNPWGSRHYRIFGTKFVD